jgi:hypothetical protein
MSRGVNIEDGKIPVMIWEQHLPPPFVWDGDYWIRSKDQRKFIANHKLDCWVSPKEKVPYENRSKKMGRKI